MVGYVCWNILYCFTTPQCSFKYRERDERERELLSIGILLKIPSTLVTSYTSVYLYLKFEPTVLLLPLYLHFLVTAFAAFNRNLVTSV